MATFILTNKSRSKSPIAILVNFRGKKYKKSISESVEPRLWSLAKKRVRVTAQNPEGEYINKQISKWISAADKAVEFFKDFKETPSEKDFFEKLDQFLYKREKADEQTTISVCKYIEIYLARNTGVKKRPSTQKYTNTLNKLKEYEQFKKTTINFIDIDIDFYSNFRKWFFSIPKDPSIPISKTNLFSTNYFGNIVNSLKFLYKQAKTVDKIHNLELPGVTEFIGPRKDTDFVYLDEEELLKIHNMNITTELIKEHWPTLDNNQALQKSIALTHSKNLFIIGCYTALRVSDFKRLNEYNFDSDYVYKKTQKSEKWVTIPIHWVVKEILESGFDLSNTISEQKLNGHIKEIALLAGLTKPIAVNKHIAGEQIEIIQPKWKLVSTHTARRSFATNASLNDLQIDIISEMLGHSKLTTTIKYIRSTQKQNAERARKSKFFNNKNGTARTQ
ncbi:MAG: hypothetical protein A2X18_07445 [Bacteroidetes bacterium GWF2_40_14]|nr:MAG: hypothetical protein A2X18_07445 [Bacteroidetes bacterium GWF2_40_14]